MKALLGLLFLGRLADGRPIVRGSFYAKAIQRPAAPPATHTRITA